MNWKNILLSGLITGGLIGSLMSLNLLSGVTGIGFEVAMFSFLAVILISAFTVKRIFPKITGDDVSLKHLIPISFLTFMIPVLGISAGSPNSDLSTLANIIFIGTIGGVFWSILWSLPFAIWNYFRNNSDDDEIPSDD
ncbi:MAG: hypothetical protein CMO20_03180 [Thermoplasmata archaeon]|nr:hypothetical protein [Thermoplasmata archaeon]